MRSQAPIGCKAQADSQIIDICRIAKAIRKTGKSTSQAIAIAVSRVKMWATGKGVDKDTQAKAAAAVAEWEKLRAKSHAKSAGKKSAHDLAASAGWAGEILCLANGVTSFNTDVVRQAWDTQARAWEQMHQAPMDPANEDVSAGSIYAHAYIKELWTDHLIASAGDGDLYRVDYSVGDPDSDNDTDVTFADPVPVKVQYVAISTDNMVGSDIDDDTLQKLTASAPPCHLNGTDKILLSIGQKPDALTTLLSVRVKPKSAVQQLLALANGDDKGPYGDVAYADPKNKKYPIDTAAHVRAAWSYVNMPKNQKDYSSAELAAIKSKIKGAAKKLGVEISED